MLLLYIINIRDLTAVILTFWLRFYTRGIYWRGKKDLFMPRLWTEAHARVTASVLEGTEA